MRALPDTKYADTPDGIVAYQAFGGGQHQVVLVPGLLERMREFLTPLFAQPVLAALALVLLALSVVWLAVSREPSSDVVARLEIEAREPEPPAAVASVEPPPQVDRAVEPIPAPAPPPEQVAATTKPAEIQVAILESAALPVYAQPAWAASGFPIERSSALIRSARTQLPRITALVPPHLAATAEATATLYWFLSEPTDRMLFLSVLDMSSQESVLELELKGPHPAGIAGFDLARSAARLETGHTYQWFVSVVAEEAPGPNDAIASGAIRRIASTAEISRDLEAAGGSRATQVYAKHGLWYDALRAISGAIEAAPADASLKRQRSALLAQVGLDEAAAAAR